MRLEYYGCSRTGQVREHNEDAFLMCAEADTGLFLVADGIGGREHGEVASGMIRDSYFHWWEDIFLPVRETIPFSTALEGLREELLRINRALVQRYDEMQVGSTLALLFVCRGRCACLSAGDSRIYRMRHLFFRQMTRDDTERNLPGRTTVSTGSGRLTGAVGLRASMQFSIQTDAVRPGDRYFLCSDGVYRCLTTGTLYRRLLPGGWMAPERIVERIGSVVEKKARRTITP